MSEEHKDMSNEEMYQFTKDVLSEAMDNLEQEQEYSETKAPTFEEAQVAQTEDIEAVKTEEEEKPETVKEELPGLSEELSVKSELS